LSTTRPRVARHTSQAGHMVKLPDHEDSRARCLPSRWVGKGLTRDWVLRYRTVKGAGITPIQGLRRWIRPIELYGQAYLVAEDRTHSWFPAMKGKKKARKAWLDIASIKDYQCLQPTEGEKCRTNRN